MLKVILTFESTEWEPAVEQWDATGWDSHTNSDGESSTEQDVGSGWDSHASSDWESSTEQDVGSGWDSHANRLPGEDDADSGYASSESSPSKSSPKSISEIKYGQLPFRTRHYFYTYVQQILEATCVRYAREHLRTYLEDLEWKKRYLVCPLGELSPDRRVWRDWLAEDELELESWMRLLEKCAEMRCIKLPKGSGRILESVMDLRNAAVHREKSLHREKSEKLGFEELSLAMKFPGQLGDSKGKSEIDDAFRYVTEDPTLDQDARASVEQAMYTPRPCTTRYKLLARLQTLLEATCFKNAMRRIPAVLSKHEWDMPEKIELQDWPDHFWRYEIQHDSSTNGVFPGMHPHTLMDLLWGARHDIRNVAAHRSPISDDGLIAQVHRAMNICILQDDWEQAVEIEVLAEMYCTGNSRAQVLRRLGSVIREGKIDSPYERERRVVVLGVVAREEGREVREGDALEVTDTEGPAMPKKGPWAERLWSPSMHEGLKKLEVL
ncbi:hypothetical protein IMSHALPRED_001656 [Imshaugia aleurites]|uniref:Uncharacterized protein n=1 Tax=Imshaugia aleurites TaxID=172621 RepID=A0A8H3J349_9LECA|nr:hypothetical protein IMSHALPRED_001656 [Imshaugia aleurites]